MITHTEKIQDNSKALLVLQNAKSLNRKVRRALPGECEFSQEKKHIKKQSIEIYSPKLKFTADELLTSIEAANFLGITIDRMYQRTKKNNIPFVYKRNAKYFKKEDLIKHINQYPLKKKLN